MTLHLKQNVFFTPPELPPPPFNLNITFLWSTSVLVEWAVTNSRYCCFPGNWLICFVARLCALWYEAERLKIHRKKKVRRLLFSPPTATDFIPRKTTRKLKF